MEYLAVLIERGVGGRPNAKQALLGWLDSAVLSVAVIGVSVLAKLISPNSAEELLKSVPGAASK